MTHSSYPKAKLPNMWHFASFFEQVDGIFKLILNESESIEGADHISRIIIHSWMRSDPPCLGSWAREKMQLLNEEMKNVARELQSSPTTARNDSE